MTPSRALAITLAVFSVTWTGHVARADGTPGAPLLGFGADTQGGSGGPVIQVTNLDNSGPGSLREALDGTNRTITFAVAGTLLVSSPLRPQQLTTIDGRTAPDPGITIAPYPGYDGVLLELDGDEFGAGNTRDIIVRNLRFRGSQLDNIRLEDGAHDIVIDHCSSTRAVDGNLDISEACYDVTVQWCILGSNRRNMLIHTDVGGVSLHHNLFVAGGERNPQAHTRSGPIDLVNNVVYDWDPTVDDWGGDPGYGVRFRSESTGNLIRNAFIASPRSDPTLAVIIENASVFTEGNEIPAGSDDTSTATERWDAPDVGEVSVEEAITDVLAEAGAFPRDIEDTALVEAVESGTVPVDGTPSTGTLPVPGEVVLRVQSAAPSGDGVALAFAVPAAGRITIDVFDVSGRRVERVLETVLAVGAGRAFWWGESAGSGVYWARLRWQPAGGYGAGRTAIAPIVRLR